MKVTVEIPEVHITTIELDMPDDATDQQICEAANQQLQEADDLVTEYSYTLEDDEYEIRRHS